MLNVHSDVGGVVGGVMGSLAEGELQSLSSVRLSTSRPCIEVVERTGGPGLLLDANLGDRADSSECTSRCKGATDSRNGTRRESFMSS